MGHIEQNNNFNFRHLFDEENDIYTDSHICEYVNPNQINDLCLVDNFSVYSHNVRSLSGHFNDLLDIIYSMQPFKFSVLALQEIWSIGKVYEIPGYYKLEYKTCFCPPLLSL